MENFLTNILAMCSQMFAGKQIIGFLISEDPAYITSHKNARREIMKIDRYDLMRDMLASYLKLDDDTDVRVFKK